MEQERNQANDKQRSMVEHSEEQAMYAVIIADQAGLVEILGVREAKILVGGKSQRLLTLSIAGNRCLKASGRLIIARLEADRVTAAVSDDQHVFGDVRIDNLRSEHPVDIYAGLSRGRLVLIRRGSNRFLSSLSGNASPRCRRRPAELRAPGVARFGPTRGQPEPNPRERR